MDRGLDIGEAKYKGIPLGWISPVGYCHPAYFEKEEFGWLRTWPGGLVTGCGLRNVGSPTEQNGEPFGLHGRLSHLPAENCVCSENTTGEQAELKISGRLNESRMFGENLVLTRTISTRSGDNRIIIDDEVVNQGFRTSQLMLLYHINIGFPVVSADARMVVAEHEVRPRDEEAAKGLDQWQECQEPTADYAEQCFYHDIPAGSDGLARMAVSNPVTGLEVEVAYRKAELPFMTQWKQMGQGEYVMGLEPANCHPEGVVAEREKFKSLREIGPGEKVNVHVEIAVKEI